MKNNMQDFMGAGTDGYKDIRLLQIMPLPENMTVMVVDTDHIVIVVRVHNHD